MATSEFGKAFRAARDAGDKTFMFNGKSYTTKLKEEVEPSKAPAKSAAKTEDSNPKTYSDMLKNMPAGTSDAAKQAVIANMAKEKASTPASEVSDDDEAASYKARASSYSGPKDSEDDGFLGKSMRTSLGSKYKKGGKTVKKMASGGSASSRGDGIAQRGKTRGKYL
jgi:hypothetical protein